MFEFSRWLVIHGLPVMLMGAFVMTLALLGLSLYGFLASRRLVHR